MLKRIPESTLMLAEEETAFVQVSSSIEINSPLVGLFSTLCPNFKQGNILDIGCGAGSMLVQFINSYNSSMAVGIDASEYMCSHANALINKFQLNNKIQIKNIVLPANFDEEKQSFDLIFSRSTLHHFQNPLDFWQIVKDYSKDNGSMFIVDLLRLDSMEEVNKLVFERFGNDNGPMSRSFKKSIMASFNLEEIKQHINMVGLRNIIIGFDNCHCYIYRNGSHTILN